MNNLVIIALCVVFAAVVSARPDEQYDQSLVANIDVDDALQNERLKKQLFLCFKTGEKCTAQFKKMKDILPEALQTHCAKCSEEQKELVKKVLRNIAVHNPNEFLDIEAIYDKDHIFRTKYAEEIKNDNIVLPPLAH